MTKILDYVTDAMTFYSTMNSRSFNPLLTTKKAEKSAPKLPYSRISPRPVRIDIRTLPRIVNLSSIG